MVRRGRVTDGIVRRRTSRNGEPNGQERRRFRRPCQQIQDREGNAVYPLGEGRRPRYPSVHLCAQSSHRRAQAVGPPRRQRRLSQSRRLTHLQRLPRDGNSAGQKPQPSSAALRGNGPGAERPRLDHGLERRRRAHQPSSGRKAPCSPFRSTATTSTSTAPAGSRCATSR